MMTLQINNEILLWSITALGFKLDFQSHISPIADGSFLYGKFLGRKVNLHSLRVSAKTILKPVKTFGSS